jgi:hypothetical protein
VDDESLLRASLSAASEGCDSAASTSGCWISWGSPSISVCDPAAWTADALVTALIQWTLLSQQFTNMQHSDAGIPHRLVVVPTPELVAEQHQGFVHAASENNMNLTYHST